MLSDCNGIKLEVSSRNVTKHRQHSDAKQHTLPWLLLKDISRKMRIHNKPDRSANTTYESLQVWGSTAQHSNQGHATPHHFLFSEKNNIFIYLKVRMRKRLHQVAHSLDGCEYQDGAWLKPEAKSSMQVLPMDDGDPWHVSYLLQLFTSH